MVDDMKKQMRRFEHIIGFEGVLDVSSRASMKELINALDSRYKRDIQSSLRLHRLEFFYDLVQSRLKKKKPREGGNNQSKVKGEEVEGMIQSDDILTVQPKDIDDWKDLMALSKIYYVLEHPRSVGLTWKRRIAKKKTIDKFGDMDLIEWKVAQNFRLRGLEEWAQRRSDARKMAEQSGYEDSDDSSEGRELDELLEVFDPASRSHKRRKKKEKKPAKPSVDRPFKFGDECMEDWTESYSEDSEESGAGVFVEEIEDFPDVPELKLGEFQVTDQKSFEGEENVSEILLGYCEFSKYRSPIFEQMDEAQNIMEWYKLYHMRCPIQEEKKLEQEYKPAEDKKKRPELDAITEQEEEGKDVVPEQVTEEKSEVITEKEKVPLGEKPEVVTGEEEKDITEPGITENIQQEPEKQESLDKTESLIEKKMEEPPPSSQEPEEEKGIENKQEDESDKS